MEERSVDGRGRGGGGGGRESIEINHSLREPLDQQQPFHSFRRNPMYLPPTNGHTSPALIPTNSLSSLRNHGSRINSSLASSASRPFNQSRSSQNDQIQSVSTGVPVSSSASNTSPSNTNSRRLNANMIKSGLYSVSG